MQGPGWERTAESQHWECRGPFSARPGGTRGPRGQGAASVPVASARCSAKGSAGSCWFGAAGASPVGKLVGATAQERELISGFLPA